MLCDFGLSRIRHEISRTHTILHQGGRQRFIAPEISSGLEARINEKSDVYSLAMTIYALGARSMPFGHIDRDIVACRAAREGERPQQCDSLGGLTTEETAHLWSLLERMWSHNPRCRPTVSSARDETMRTGQMCLSLATTSIATPSTNVLPSRLTASLDITRNFLPQMQLPHSGVPPNVTLNPTVLQALAQHATATRSNPISQQQRAAPSQGQGQPQTTNPPNRHPLASFEHVGTIRSQQFISFHAPIDTECRRTRGAVVPGRGGWGSAPWALGPRCVAAAWCTSISRQVPHTHKKSTEDNHLTSPYNSLHRQETSKGR